MERLASHNLHYTSGHPDGAARELYGPSLRDGEFPMQDGLSLCPPADPDVGIIFGGGEYKRFGKGNTIPGIPVIGSAEDGKSPIYGAQQPPVENTPPQKWHWGTQLNIMAGFLDYTCVKFLRIMSGNRAIPAGHRASRSYRPAGLGPAQHVFKW